MSALRREGPAARLIAPLSGSLAGSARPTVRWEGPEHVTIQICADRSCRRPLWSFSATGHQTRPPRALDAGAVFWRIVSGRPTRGSAPTPVWELFVPDCGAGDPDANRGLRYDANADGFADAVVRDQNGNARTDVLHIFAGGPHGIRASRVTDLTLDTSHFGVGTSAAGDVDGDGFGDVAVADGRGVVVYAGSPTGPRPTPLAVLPVPAGVNDFDFGFELSGLGDVNGDGYGDLAVGDGARRVWVYLGGPTGPGTIADWVLDRSGQDQGARLLTAGDLDGDGLGDLTVADCTGTACGIRFFHGRNGGLELATAGTFVPRSGVLAAAAGDVDGDGVMDLVTVEGTTLALFLGGPGFPSAPPAQLLTVPTQPGPIQLGDFDGDGDFDLAATSSLSTSIIYFTDDRIDLYRAGPNGFAPTPARTIRETDVLPDNQLNFGLRLGNADFNGDGREDLLVGSPPPYPTPFFDTSPSAAFVFEGTRHRLLDPTPAPRLDGPPGFGAFVTAGVPQSGP